MTITQREQVIFVVIVSTIIFATIIPSKYFRTGGASSAFGDKIPPTSITMRINGVQTPPWVVPAGTPFTVTGILGLNIGYPPTVSPLPGKQVVFFCTGLPPLPCSIKGSTTTSEDGSYTLRLTAPNQGSYKVGVVTAFPPGDPDAPGSTSGPLIVKPCTSEKPCTSSKIATERR